MQFQACNLSGTTGWKDYKAEEVERVRNGKKEEEAASNSVTEKQMSFLSCVQGLYRNI